MIQQEIDIRTPASRTSDPVTSHEAEEEITANGKRQAQQNEVLAMVQRNQGCTSAEIAAAEEVDRYMVARRLPELAPDHVFKGKPRKCRESDRRAVVWFTVGSVEDE